MAGKRGEAEEACVCVCVSLSAECVRCADDHGRDEGREEGERERAHEGQRVLRHSSATARATAQRAARLEREGGERIVAFERTPQE